MPYLKDTRTIVVNWKNEKSISDAEKLKTECENDGYTLVKTVINHATDISILTYHLIG